MPLRMVTLAKHPEIGQRIVATDSLFHNVIYMTVVSKHNLATPRPLALRHVSCDHDQACPTPRGRAVSSSSGVGSRWLARRRLKLFYFSRHDSTPASLSDLLNLGTTTQGRA